ncbi:ABC transporter permease [candidate division KSB1 bacterium]
MSEIAMQNKHKNIPGLLGRLLVVFTDEEDLIHLKGDYFEIYNDIYQHRRRISADLWIIRQIIRSALIYFSDLFYGSLIMFMNYLKITIRNIRRYKVYSFINIAGLSIGIACFLAIFLYIRFETSYDNYHEDAGRIFRVARTASEIEKFGNTSGFACICGPAATFLKENFPQVERAARLRFSSRALIQYGDKLFYESNFLRAEQEIFDILHIPVITGDPDNIINRPRTIAISEEMSKKYFGGEDPSGKIIKVNNMDYEVTGVVSDPPRNTHLKYNFIANLDYENGPEWYRSMWNAATFHTYIKFYQDIDIESFEKSINDLLQVQPVDFNGEWVFFLQHVTDIHLRSALFDEIEPPGNPKYLMIFTVIGIIVVLIASVNFINLLTARSTSRAMEVGMRKVVGAKRSQLIRQFLGESTILSFLSIIMSFIIVLLSLPLLSGFTGIKYEIYDLVNPEIIMGFLGLAVIVGSGAGIYPAFLLSGFRPVQTIKGYFRTGKSGIALREYLVIFQFAITAIMIISTLIIYFQLNYMKNAYLGFDKEQKLIIPARLTERNYEAIKSEFLKYHNIKSAAASSSVPGRITARFGTSRKDADFYGKGLNYLTVDYDFISEYNLVLIAGEDFKKGKYGSASRVCLINEAAVKLLELGSPENVPGKEIYVGLNYVYKIIGVIADFHNRGLQQKIDPLCIVYAESQPTFINDLYTITLTVETPSITETLSFVEKKWRELNLGSVFSYYFIDEDFNRHYRTEERVGKIFSTFTALGLFIAFLGLFGLALFTAEQRTKEIGIRKTLGATIMSIIQLLTKEFVKWVAVGIIIAFPAAYFAMDLWLQNFAYRIEIGWLPFAASAALAILLSIITVSFHAIKSATANPVDSLRYE